MSGEGLGWDAWIGDAGLKHANAVELGGTPESAVLLAMARARQKYGEQDWSTWEWSAREYGTRELRVIPFFWH